MFRGITFWGIKGLFVGIIPANFCFVFQQICQFFSNHMNTAYFRHNFYCCRDHFWEVWELFWEEFWDFSSLIFGSLGHIWHCQVSSSSAAFFQYHICLRQHFSAIIMHAVDIIHKYCMFYAYFIAQACAQFLGNMCIQHILVIFHCSIWA